MALTDRLHFSFSNVNGRYYKVAVKYNGATTVEAKAAPPCFQITYKPETDKIFTGITPSVAEIYFYEDSDDISDFLTELIDYQQDDYWLEITSSTDDITYTPYWRGIILQDQIQKQEASRPFMIKLTALDGLALLKTKDYDQSNIVTSEPARTKLNDILRTALAKGLTTDLWGASDAYFINTINWWDSAQTYSATGDPFETLYVDTIIFQIWEDVLNSYVRTGYIDTYKVLNELAKAFGARLYMADGAYYFEQVSERSNANVKRVKYDKTGTQLSTGLTNYDVPLDETEDSARFKDNLYSYFPALKEVTATQRVYPNRADNSGNVQTWNTANMSTNTASVRDWGIFDEQVNVGGSLFDNALAFTLDIQTISSLNVTGTNTINGSAQWWYEFDMQIKLDDIATTTDYYWDDDGSTWTTSVTSFTFKGPISSFIRNITGTGTWVAGVPKTISVTTDILPATGRVTVTLGTIVWKYKLTTSFQSSTIVQGTGTSVNVSGGGIILSLDEVTEQGSTTKLQVANLTNANVGDDEKVDLGEIFFGDGSRSSGNILPYNGTSIVRGGNWRRANESTNINLGGLLVSERIRLQTDVLEVYDGLIQMPLGYAYSISFDSKRYLPLNYTFNAFKSEVNGRYFLIGRDAAVSPDLNTGDLFIRQPNRADIFGKTATSGEIGRIVYALETFGFIRHNSTDGEAQTIAPAKMESGQRNNYTEITAENSSSDTLTTTDTIALLSWTGADGSFTLNIPDPLDMDGARLEIILNSDFTGSREVVIRPASGNIRGAATLTVSSEGSLNIRAVNGNWY